MKASDGIQLPGRGKADVVAGGSLYRQLVADGLRRRVKWRVTEERGEGESVTPAASVSDLHWCDERIRHVWCTEVMVVLTNGMFRDYIVVAVPCILSLLVVMPCYRDCTAHVVFDRGEYERFDWERVHQGLNPAPDLLNMLKS